MTRETIERHDMDMTEAPLQAGPLSSDRLASGQVLARQAGFEPTT